VEAGRDSVMAQGKATRGAAPSSDEGRGEGARREPADAEAPERSVIASPRFVGALVHELRSPLSTLSMVAELLAENRSGHLDEKEIRWAGALAEAAADLGELLDQAGRLARIEAGRVTVHTREVSLREVLKELEEELSAVASAHRVALDWEVAGSGPSRLTTDRVLLAELVRALVHAALSGSHGGVVTVSVAAEPAPGDSGPDQRTQVRFQVSDNGPTLGNAEAAELLLPFRRQDPRTSRRHGGIGLSLVVARALADLLGGELTAEGGGQGEPGVRFVLRLPTASSQGVRS
jgi:two-component system, chemotaxis family, sensor kinase CheA